MQASTAEHVSSVQYCRPIYKYKMPTMRFGVVVLGLGLGFRLRPNANILVITVVNLLRRKRSGVMLTPEIHRLGITVGLVRGAWVLDKLPTEAQLKAIKVLRGKLAKFVTARKQKNPCQHCGDITLPGSRRTLVRPGDFSSGYYCRPCAQHQRMRGELPSEMAIRDRRLRKHLKLKRLGLEYQQKMESETKQAEQAKSTEGPEEKDQG
jgi:hypothetical protein